VQEWPRDGRLFALPSFGDRRLGALQSGLRRSNQPALGHAIVASLKTLIAGLVIHRVPGVPREGLRDHRRDRAKGVGNPCDKAEGWEVGGLVLRVALRVGAQIPRARGVLKGRHQRLRPLLEDLDIRRLASPTCAAKGNAPILRDHQFQDGLLEVRPVIFGVAVGERHRLLIAVGNVLPTERNAGGVEMLAAPVKACLGTDRQGQSMTQQGAALGVGLIGPGA
jgi:hypothetical protein